MSTTTIRGSRVVAPRARNGGADRRTVPCGICGADMRCRYGVTNKQPRFCATCRSVHPDLVKKWSNP